MLDARQLEALAAVIEEGSFGAAAKALHLTLAAVSLRIKTLEEALGQRLLVRGKQVRAKAANAPSKQYRPAGSASSSITTRSTASRTWT